MILNPGRACFKPLFELLEESRIIREAAFLCRAHRGSTTKDFVICDGKSFVQDVTVNGNVKLGLEQMGQTGDRQIALFRDGGNQERL